MANNATHLKTDMWSVMWDFGILIWFSRDQLGGVIIDGLFWEFQRYPMTTMGAITFIFA
jgi:hypothetical protein